MPIFGSFNKKPHIQSSDELRHFLLTNENNQAFINRLEPKKFDLIEDHLCLWAAVKALKHTPTLVREIVLKKIQYIENPGLLWLVLDALGEQEKGFAYPILMECQNVITDPIFISHVKTASGVKHAYPEQKDLFEALFQSICNRLEAQNQQSRGHSFHYQP